MQRISWYLSNLSVMVLGASLLACASGSSNSPDTRTAGQSARTTDDEQARREQAEQRVRTRQEAACNAVSHVITRCAIADARATMPPEEFAKLDVEKLAPAHRVEFVGECTSSDMSVRQVEVFEQCMGKQAECGAFLDCLDQARPH